MKPKTKTDRFRGSARKRGYTTAWEKESRAHRRANPLCARCKRNGKIRACDVTGHKKPIRYFPELAMDPDNWESLCTECNAIQTAEDERKYAHLKPKLFAAS